MTATYLQAQSVNFTAADPQPDILEIYAPDSVSGDIHGDGDVDLFQSGIAPRQESGLFRNDGNGNCQEVEGITFPRATGSAVILEDLDNDGDLDILVTGSQGGGLPNIYNIVYENLGTTPLLPQTHLGGSTLPVALSLTSTVMSCQTSLFRVLWHRQRCIETLPTITSLEELREIPGLTMFPNPSNGRLTIKNTKDVPGLSLRIFASDGRLVYEQQGLFGISADLRHNLPAGTYVVQFNAGTSTVAKTLVVVE